MTYFPPNPVRGLIGLAALGSLVAGAWLLWGFGAALFAGGLVVWLDASSDEVVERVTRTKRG